VIEVSELIVKLAAGRVPKKSPVALVKLVPVKETEVPPPLTPKAGLRPVFVAIPG
jgi:hypothetical protein